MKNYNVMNCYCQKHVGYFMRQDKKTLRQYCPQCEKNANKRAENQILRDLCGTSARAAREDMGL